MTTASPNWFDVPAMLQASLPRPRANWWRWVFASALIGLLVATLTSSTEPVARLMLWLVTGMVLIAFFATLLLMAFHLNRALAEERQRLEQVEEMVTLRQWPVAASLLHQLLLRPMLTHHGRVRALMSLSSVLGRYHRYLDALEVHNHLLETIQLDGMTTFQIRVARAMAILREDHLLDADRAISEMKRMPGAAETGVFALVNIFRDVKTGHYDEAIEIYRKQQKVLAQHLGHRCADAHLLIALAHLQRGNRDEAAVCFEKATLLAPAIELKRRFPEAEKLFNEFTPASAPQEAM